MIVFCVLSLSLLSPLCGIMLILFIRICRGIFLLSVFLPCIRGCFAPFFLAVSCGLLILILSDLVVLDLLVTLGSVVLL